MARKVLPERAHGGGVPVRGGEMADLIPSHDWAATPLGPMESWPQGIRSAVDLMLAMRQPVCIWWGQDARIVYNDEYATILGRRHPHALGRTMPEVWPELIGTMQHPLDAVRTAGSQSFVDQVFPLATDGEVTNRWFSATWTPIYDDSGAVIGTFDVSTETTDRVLIEQTLRESRAQLARELEDTKQLQKVSRMLVEDEGDEPLYEQILDAAMAMMRADFGSIQLLDAKRNELRLLAWRHFHPESAAVWHSVSIDSGTTCSAALLRSERMIVPNVAAADVPVNAESLRQYRLSGIAAVQSTPLTTREGRLVGMISTHWRQIHTPDERDLRLLDILARQAADFLERRRALEAQRESQAQLQSFYETAPFLMGIGEIDGDRTVVLSANRMAAEYLGKRAEVRAGRSSADPAAPDDVQALWLDHLERSRRDGAPVSFEYQDAQFPGSPWLSCTVALIGTSASGRPQYSFVVEDITERKRSEQRREYLLRLSDTLRPLSDPIEIQQKALQLVGETLDLDRVMYNEIDPAVSEYTVSVNYVREGFAPHVGRFPLRPFARSVTKMRQGETDAIDDVETDGRFSDEEKAILGGLKVASFVVVPLIKDGQWVLNLVAHDSKPRAWTQHEVSVLEQTAERTWAAVERARAEASLRESEEKYRTLFETMGQGYADIELVRDADGRAVDQFYHEFNPAFERLIGIPVAEAKGRRASEVLPDLEPWWHEAFDRIAKRGEQERIEYVVASLGRWYEVFAYPRGGDRLTVLYEDITERRRAEEALHESETRLRAFNDLVPDLLWRSDPTGTQVSLNQRWMEYTGQTDEEIRNGGWLRAIHPDDIATSMATFEAAFASGTPMTIEHRVRRHDGIYRWFLVRQVPFRDASGAITEWFGAATDIHEGRLAREDLEARVAERTADLVAAVEDVRRSEERLQLLLNQMPAMLWTTDEMMCLTALVGASIPTWPAARGGVDGLQVSDLFADTDLDGAAQTIHQQVLGGTPVEFEFRVDSHTYEAYVEPLRDATGDIIGTIGAAHNVTDRTLRTLQEGFIASVSHELQTPLTSIRAALGLLDAAIGKTLEPAERELLAAARRNAERLRLEIGQLLAANQVSVGERAVERATVDLRGVVETAVETMAPLLQEKDQKVDVDMPDHLEVEGDRRLLEQVLANLLSNAHRHTPPGTRIAVSGWFVGDHVRLAVHDAGPGIPPDQLDAIFGRFYRTPGMHREGIGLGLAITRDAVEAQGGRVWAESVLGQGSTFFVSLPRARSSDASRS
ncbi:MAG TPA: PAS domain S-box protein [Chloroflexota bacterium]|nr:PAS domain S-box protein [Chloroflexota bacterium]